MNLGRGLFLFSFFSSVLFSVQSSAFSSCPDGHVQLSQSKKSLMIAGPRLGSSGAIWTYKTFEVGRLYRFCLDFPVLKIGRAPNYKTHHDNLVVETLPPPFTNGSDIYISLINPNGVKFVEVERNNSSYRRLTVKYRQASTWILEIMVRNGSNQFGVEITEEYDRYLLRNGNNFRALGPNHPDYNNYD